MKDIGYYLRRLLFLVAFFLAGGAFVEKVLNILGYTILGDYYSPWRLLEFSAICLLFIIVLQLRELNFTINKQAIKNEPK